MPPIRWLETLPLRRNNTLRDEGGRPPFRFCPTGWVPGQMLTWRGVLDHSGNGPRPLGGL